MNAEMLKNEGRGAVDNLTKLKQLHELLELASEIEEEHGHSLEEALELANRVNGYELPAADQVRLREQEQAAKERQNERQHTERIKALELGAPYYEAEVARARSRARAAGTIGVLVPLFLAAAATVATWLVSFFPAAAGEDSATRLTVYLIIWGVSGGVTLLTVLACLLGLRQRPLHGPVAPHANRMAEDAPL